MTGHLAGSVFRTPGVGSGGIAEAMVSPDTIYAAPSSGAACTPGSPGCGSGCATSGRLRCGTHGWVKHEVTIPARPYMDVAVDETIANGSLERAGMAAFEAVVW